MDTDKTTGEIVDTQTTTTAQKPEEATAGCHHGLHGHHHGNEAEGHGHHHHDGEGGEGQHAHHRHHHDGEEDHGHHHHHGHGLESHHEGDAGHGHRHNSQGHGNHRLDASSSSALICPCMGTTTEDIVQAVAAGATTAEDIERMTGAGTRCGHCRQEIAACLEEALAAKA